MKLNANAFALAVLAAAAITWVVCWIVVFLFPGMSMTMTGYMMHAEVEGMQWSMHFTSFIGGLLIWSLASGAIAWLVAVFYNKLSS